MSIAEKMEQLKANLRGDGGDIRYVEDDWEFMGEQVKMEDDIETSVSYADPYTEPYDPLSLEEDFTFPSYCPARGSHVEELPKLTVNDDIKPVMQIANNSLAPSTLTISDNDLGELVVVHLETGEVDFGENYEFSRASEIFWVSMGKESPQHLLQKIEALESEIQELKFPTPPVPTATEASREKLNHQVRDNLELIGETTGLYEANDTVTRHNLYVEVDAYMARLHRAGLIEGYDIVCDETNNGPSVIVKNQIGLDVTFQPARTVEYIHTRVYIESNGKYDPSLEVYDVDKQLEEAFAYDCSDLDADLYFQESGVSSAYDAAMKIIE